MNNSQLLTVQSNRTSVSASASSLATKIGSYDWAVAVRRQLAMLLQQQEFDVRSLTVFVCAFKKHRGWEILRDRNGKPFPSFEAFCVAPRPYGLNYEPADIDAILKAISDVQRMAKEAKPLAPHGGDRKGQKRESNSGVFAQENKCNYLTARIARDRPDILERMKNGEFKSVRAAALEAGIVKQRVVMEPEPTAMARVIKRHLLDKEIADLIELLQRP